MPKFVPRVRKQKALLNAKQQNGGSNSNNADTNADEILPDVLAERQKEKQKMKAAIKAEQPQMSSKKKKRLDKYIDKKLRKEENLDLIKTLADTKVDTALLQSSRSLGVTKASKREVFKKALAETKAGINVEKNQNILLESRPRKKAELTIADDNIGDESSGDRDFKPTPALKVAQGSGLKRPLELGPGGNPILTRRKRRKVESVIFDTDAKNGEESWEGFSEAAWEESPPSASDSETFTDSETGDNRRDTSSASESETFTNREIYDDRRNKSSAFKIWATGQVNEAVGFTPSSAITDNLTSNGNFKSASADYRPPSPDIEPLPPELALESKNVDRKAFGITVDRTDTVQSARLQLPIAGEEQRIMEAVHNHPTVIICGETGSGKTTQVPQFLYEAGFGHMESPNPGLIGVTQPRRVAAVSMANRVATELAGTHAEKVAYQVRYDTSVSKDTAIKFMTDGILLREIASDFPLSKYSAIIIDEAHERSLNTDILIGLLSRIVDLRATMSKEQTNIKSLKLIIMSATLRTQDFLGNKVLFRSGQLPLIQVEGRQHSVTMHFARRTQSDYAQQAFEKICKGHNLLPPGGILVFLTAQDEIVALIQRLKERFEPTKYGNMVMIDQDDYESASDSDAKEFEVDELAPSNKTPNIHVLPLYAQLDAQSQLRVFEPPPNGSRLIVVATNVAETSITIPGIRYVFDCGRSKEKTYDSVSGVQSFEVGWISKAAASQRAGRAGRIGPGHCYRLYSSAVYERDFEEHTEPEILRMPLDGVVLQLKNMELHNVVNFPFPTPPDRTALAKAERLLKYLGALSGDGRITSPGRNLTKFPVSTRYAKILDIGQGYESMAFTILLVAAVATPNLFIPEHLLGLNESVDGEPYSIENRAEEEARLQRKIAYNRAHYHCSKYSSKSDGLKAFVALQGYMKAKDKEQYCRDTYVSLKSAREASSLADQLTSIIRKIAPLALSTSSSGLSSLSDDQIAALQRFVAAGFIDQLAILASEAPSLPYLGRNPKRAIDVPYLPLFPISTDKRTAGSDIRDIAVYIHPSSILAKLSTREMPKYIVYSHLQRAQPQTIEASRKPKTRMHALTITTEKVIFAWAQGTPLLEYGKPLSILEEKVSAKGKTRTCIVQPSLVGEKGTMAWPLPARKVDQVRNSRGEWIVEKTYS
ncbi:uncharacterized protein KY384_003561 [Bacidia gigantensis]|uniref:uncharacterized protein n=1 Tax=Bacidia gigantensis TaxID=2732470 RepID=UPI001D052EDB|nr:uncharacterized protein KY384_003561 [Bacidia gigantensis]KAG8531925.1 hypothetical protein KY384_003561 [Bacidia gigantensis]